jgi:hypothetical protein
MAQQNASKARQDADMAETTAAQLAQTLQSLQTVVNETKLASQTLVQEQQMVDQKAADIETKYLQQKQELLRVTKTMEQLRQSNALLEHARDLWKHERKTMEQQVKRLQGTIDALRRDATNQAAVEELRQQRAEQNQLELVQAQQLLTHATEQYDANQKVQWTLQETVATLESANAALHEKLVEQQSGTRDTVERLNTDLSNAERHAQKLHLDKEALEEELKRIKLEKEASVKQYQELKLQVMAAKCSSLPTALTSPPGAASLSTDRQHSTTEDTPQRSANNTIVFRLPPLPGSAKTKPSNNPDVICGKSCCICFKPSFGIMKSCPCGNCEERAHILCVKQVTAPPSVSHPGTPASPHPVVLCKLHNRYTFLSQSSAKKQQQQSQPEK